MQHFAVILIVSDIEKYLTIMSSIAKNKRHPDLIFIVNNSDASLKAPLSLKNTTFKIFDQHYPVSHNSAIRLGFRQIDSDLIFLLTDDDIIDSSYFESIRIAAVHNSQASVFYPASNNSHKCCLSIRGSIIPDIPIIPSSLTTYFGAEWIFFWTSTVMNRPWIEVSATSAVCNKTIDFESDLFKMEADIFNTIISGL
jgi:hypothetical protein